MEPKKLYTVDWTNPTDFVKVGDFEKVPLPKMPPLATMENYGLPIEQQKFKRTALPDSVLKRKAFVEDGPEDTFIKNEYHKIHNGVWIIIKGTPIYLTGAYYFFLNYWTTNQGQKPSFKLIQCHLFLIWEMVINDTNSYGLFLIKPRRIGGTEITIEWLYLDVLRYRNMVCGMQSKNEDSVYKNYKRILNAHKNMIWFMKPINQGSTGNREGLFLRYPEEMLTAKKLKESAENGEKESVYEDPEINSDLTYQPSVATAYDGERLDRYILNEFGKSEKMSVVDCWDKVKPCLHLDNGLVISGKAVCESTIEEINDDQILELVEMDADSDPNNRNENGRTTSGLYSLFINALDASKEDEYGFPKREETLAFLEKEFENLKKAGKTKELAKLKRKVPLTKEDALTPSGDQTAFSKDNLIDALSEIDFSKTKKETVRGNLVWENGIIDGRVIFIEDPNGLFEFSVLPGPNTYQDNNVEYYRSFRVPGNVHLIRIGVDPYDHKEVVESRKSKGGAVGFLMYNDLKDGAKSDSEGAPYDLAKDWETYRPIFTYYHRHDDPQVFFEDMLKACVFCGAPMLFENQKQSIKTHFHNRGYEKFVMLRPESTLSNNQGKSSITEGINANELTIQQYYDSIASYVMKYAKAIKHRDLLVDLLAMNRKNHGKHDLGVAFGWTLLAITKSFPKQAQQQEVTEPWFDEVYV